MQKSVQNVKNSLKFKASPKSGILSVKVGVKKFAIPVEARMLSNGDYLFLSFSASSELYTIQGKELKPMPSDQDATDAFAVLNPGKRRGRRKRESVQMPPELEQALRALPAGYKLGYGTDGTPKLVKARTRKKSKA
jgi:hypothetical protein